MPSPDPANPSDVASSDLRRNVELKAQLPSLSAAREVARALATEYLGIQHQTDTYFRCPHGRLKLREIDGQSAQLIWYNRSDEAHARKSEYYLLTVAEPALARQVLTNALGIRQTVVKQREIFLHANVRIHLDDVRDLGGFLEFEAVMAPHQDLAQGHAQLVWLCDQFAIAPAQILAKSYGDMV